MRGKLFLVLGAALVLLSFFFSYIELGHALAGSAEAWMALSALICAGVLGLGMVRVGRGTDLARADGEPTSTVSFQRQPCE